MKKLILILGLLIVASPVWSATPTPVPTATPVPTPSLTPTPGTLPITDRRADVNCWKVLTSDATAAAFYSPLSLGDIYIPADRTLYITSITWALQSITDAHITWSPDTTIYIDQIYGSIKEQHRTFPIPKSCTQGSVPLLTTTGAAVGKVFLGGYIE